MVGNSIAKVKKWWVTYEGLNKVAACITSAIMSINREYGVTDTGIEDMAMFF